MTTAVIDPLGPITFQVKCYNAISEISRKYSDKNKSAARIQTRCALPWSGSSQWNADELRQMKSLKFIELSSELLFLASLRIFPFRQAMLIMHH